MSQQTTRRSKGTRQKELNSLSEDPSDTSLSRINIKNSNKINPSSSTSLMTTAQPTISTHTAQENLLAQSSQSKSIPSFAETQLLSIYYLNRNITNQPIGSTNKDSCVFIEQQERQPIRFRAAYDPLATTKSTQKPVPSTALRHLSTHGSTLIVDGNQQPFALNNQLYEQRLRIHSGSQRLANNPSLITEIDEPSSPSEPVEESRYSYEEYIIHVDNNQQQKTKPISSSSATSTSSLTTIIPQQSSSQPPSPVPPPPPPPPPPPVSTKTMLHSEELDSDRTSRLSVDEVNTHSTASSMSGSFTNQDWATQPNILSMHTNDSSIVNTRQTTSKNETTRISSWPPVPYDIAPGDTQFETSFVLDESDEQRRPTRVQFAEQLIHVIPPSITNSISEESPPSIPPPPPTTNINAPAITPRTTTNRLNSNEYTVQKVNLDVEDDDTTTTTTTSSSNKEQFTGRLQRTSGLTNLHEVMMNRPTIAPPPPPPPPPPPSSNPSGVDPRLVREQLKRLDYQLVVDTRPPMNQSRWVKDHLDVNDAPSTTSGRVDALRSLFEQQSVRSSDSSTLNSPTGLIRRTEPEEKPSRHGDEIRFRVKQPKTTSVHHAEPAKVISRTKQQTNELPVVSPLTWEDLVGVQAEHQQQKQNQTQNLSYPFELNEIQQIVGKRIRSLADVGHYLKDGRTWKWNDTFWLNLTSSQRDQLLRLQQQSRSRQDSGDTQIIEYSDRSAYQGDSEDNTPKFEDINGRIRQRNTSQENFSSSSTIDETRHIKPSTIDETRRIKSSINDPGSTISVTGAGAWQQQQQSLIKSSSIGKYTEANTIHENQPSVSVFGSTPTATYTRIGSQESIASSTNHLQLPITKKSDSQTIVIESGYSSADEPQQRLTQFRPNSSTIIEEPSISHHIDTQSSVGGLIAGPGTTIISSNDIQLREQPIYENLRSGTQQQSNDLELDPLSYEQFIYDYFTTYARRSRSSDGTLMLHIDGQQIPMSHIHLPSNDNITLSKNVYLDAIDEYPPPFETESDQLVIFVQGEPIVLPSDRWAFYKKKYNNAQWIHKLDRVNRHVPNELMATIEDWLSQHTRFLLDINEIDVDGLNIPLTGKLGAHIIDLYQVRQLQSNENFYWNEILKYLIRTGYVSYDPDQQIVHIADSELDVQRVLASDSSPSPELVERLAKLLRSLDNIHFDNNNGTLILDNHFIIPNRYIRELFQKHRQGQVLNSNELADILLHICAYEEDPHDQSLILTLDNQRLRLIPSTIIQEREEEEEEEDSQRQQEIDNDVDEIFRQWISDNVQSSTEQGRIFLLRYRSMPDYLIRVTGPEGIRLANLLQRQTLSENDLLHWHENNVEIERADGSLRMIIKPNNNVEIVNLTSEENAKRRGKANEEKIRSTNQKSRNMYVEEEKNLVFFIPIQEQNLSDSEQEKKEKEYHYQRSISPSVEQKEQKKIKTNDNDDDRERALLLESISSLLHFVNANGSNVGTLELIQGRRLRLSLTGNSPLSQQQQQIEFNENDTKILCQDLDLDIDNCTKYLVDHIFDKIEFDNDKQLITIYYHNQMLTLKNLKQKLFQPTGKKLRLTPNKSLPSDQLPATRTIDENHVNILTQWLEELNEQNLITITDQNDIVILPNGERNPEQQILINHEDVDSHMQNKMSLKKSTDDAEVIGMSDLAQILLSYEYVQYSSGQLTFGTQRIALDRSELLWLRSIVRGVRPDGQNRETEIDLFDGENTQALRIPYEHMQPTNNPRLVADYLFQNGSVRYDIDTGNYAYRYVPPDIPLEDEDESAERVGQRQLLSSHIRQIHVDQDNERVELEFVHDSHNRLVLPSRWYRQALAHNFDRTYIIDMLLANGGKIDRDTFIFLDRTYSLQVPRIASTSSTNLSTANLQTIRLSTKQKQDLIEDYVELINKQDGIKRDNTNNLLLLENQSDGSQLYLTPEHSQYIHQHQYRRQDVIRLLNKHGQIKQDEFGNWLLYYNNQYVQFPSSIIPTTATTTTTTTTTTPNLIQTIGQRFTRPTGVIAQEDDPQFRARIAKETPDEFLERYHGTIDSMYHRGLITCNRRLKYIQIHFSNQALTIPLDQLRPIIDTRALNSTDDNLLPFESQQLSQWLLDNSDTISNTREGHIQLTHKNKTYNLPLINPKSQSTIQALVKRFGLTSKGVSVLSKIDFNSPDTQARCANHLLEKLDQFGGINIDNDAQTLVLSMTPDSQHKLTIRNPTVPVTKQTLINYLLNHGRFALNADRTDVEYRHYDDGRIYRFNSYIRDWDDAFGETNEQRSVRVLGDILSLNGRFLQRADRQIIILLRNGERFVIPSNIGAQLIGPVNGQTIAELLVKNADDIHEEQDGKYLVIRLADQVLRLEQQKQLMSNRAPSTTKLPADTKLKLLFPFNKSLRQIQKTPSTSTLNVHPPDASNGYAVDPLLMLANYIYRAGSIYQDDLGRLVIKMNEDEIVVPRIEAINAIETINTAPHRTGTIVARLIDRIGKVQSNKAGGLIITIGRSSFELPKELIDRANQLHRETIDIENDIPIQDRDLVQTGLNGSMTLAGRHNRQPTGPILLPSLRQSKSVGSLTSSTIGHPWFTDDQQMLYSNDGRGDARYLNLDNYPLSWQKEPHTHGVNCEVRTIRNVAPYLNVLGYVENDPKKAITINDLTRLHPEMLNRGKINDNLYLTQLENDRAQVQTKLCPKPRILVIPDDETMLSSSPKTRFYVQYMYEQDAVLGTDPAYVMMLPSRYPVQPTQPQLIAPHHYRDIALREAPVYVHKKGEGEVYFENLAQYLSAQHPDVSSRTVRRMLKYDVRNEYFDYLSKKMPTADAEQLVQESEEPAGEAPSRYVNITTKTGGSVTNLAENDDDEEFDDDFDEQYNENDNRRRIVSPRTYYNLRNDRSNPNNDQQRSIIYQNRQNLSSQPQITTTTTKFVERSPSSSSLGSDMLIANALPSRRAILGNAPSSNIPTLRNDINRATLNSLSSLTDENYGRPVVRGPI